MWVLTVHQAFILSSLDYCNSLLNKNHIRRDHLVLNCCMQDSINQTVNIMQPVTLVIH